MAPGPGLANMLPLWQYLGLARHIELHQYLPPLFCVAHNGVTMPKFELDSRVNVPVLQSFLFSVVALGNQVRAFLVGPRTRLYPPSIISLRAVDNGHDRRLQLDATREAYASSGNPASPRPSQTVKCFG